MASWRATLEAMSKTPFGWRQRDVRSLLKGAGFIMCREGSEHEVHSHPRDPARLRVVVPRRRDVKACYVRETVRVVQLALDSQEVD